MSPLANSQNGILCDLVPPMVAIRMSAPSVWQEKMTTRRLHIRYILLEIKRWDQLVIYLGTQIRLYSLVPAVRARVATSELNLK